MDNKAVLEGLLYVVGEEGLSIEQISEVLDTDHDASKELIHSLKQEYLSENRGLRIEFLGNRFKVTTKFEHKEYYQKLLVNPKTNTLSQAALETLAIIAYNEPITRVEIDKTRGVDSVHMIRKLLAKGLIKEKGRSNLPGRPILYKTTDDFLDYFGLSCIEDLPPMQEVEQEEDIEKDLYNSKYREIERE